MKFSVTFQEVNDQIPHGRPIDHPSSADFEVPETGYAAIPSKGDYVEIEPVGCADAPRYAGVVASRLFRFIGPDHCHVNVVVDSSEDSTIDWGKLIKE